MNILILGSGGREHALASQISKSPKIEKDPRIFFSKKFDKILNEDI